MSYRLYRCSRNTKTIGIAIRECNPISKKVLASILNEYDLYFLFSLELVRVLFLLYRNFLLLNTKKKQKK